MGSEIRSAALFSENRRLRFWLLREWDASLPKVAFIGLNPSIADEERNDPTIRREIGFAESWGRGGVLALNLYAFCATVPADMWRAEKRGTDIVGGPQNWVDALKGYVKDQGCDLVIAAWGAHGKRRGDHVAMHWGLGLTCLALNGDGTPKHPLYLKGDLVPVPYRVAQ
jgi:hypothetical protein